MIYTKLREKYPYFEYSSYEYKLEKNLLVLKFNYDISNKLHFIHKVKFDLKKNVESKIESASFSNLVFHLGLAEMFSYWKLVCSGNIQISAGYLNKEQISWWKDLLIEGMGQYFYENKIDFLLNDFIKITSIEESKDFKLVEVSGSKTLVPMGGGKDSVVTLETLINNKMTDAVIIVSPTTPASFNIAKVSGVKKILNVSREIDNNLINLNSKRFLNGHIPYTNVLFFISLIAAYINEYKYVAFSNEKSSDEVNVRYLGKDINHQFSKTYEFENKFRDYNQKFLSNINLFSFLRPLYEIQIAKLFSKYNRYLRIFRSCNVGQRENKWCCKCPKCLSTFILLTPFIKIEKLIKVFSRNLFEDDQLIYILDNLLSENCVKPFECVGTREELKVALYLYTKDKRNNLSVLLKYADKKYLSNKNELERKSVQILGNWSVKNNLTKEFVRVLRQSYENH